MAFKLVKHFYLTYLYALALIFQINFYGGNTMKWEYSSQNINFIMNYLIFTVEDLDSKLFTTPSIRNNNV